VSLPGLDYFDEAAKCSSRLFEFWGQVTFCRSREPEWGRVANAWLWQNFNNLLSSLPLRQNNPVAAVCMVSMLRTTIGTYIEVCLAETTPNLRAEFRNSNIYQAKTPVCNEGIFFLWNRDSFFSKNREHSVEIVQYYISSLTCIHLRLVAINAVPVLELFDSEAVANTPVIFSSSC